MTSSVGFRDWLNIFNMKLSVGEEYIEYLVQNAEKAKQYIKMKDIGQKREFQLENQKQKLRRNALNYFEGWRFSRTTSNPNLMYRLLDYYFDVMGITLNTAAFLNTVQMLGDQQQAQYWRNQINHAKVFGGYVQTELGHGSNVQGLQTTAHYDTQTQTFRLSSPSVTSTKFWPGVLGLFSTHALMQAQTYINSKYIGLQTFVIEIRDSNLQPMPGVQAGDIGPKLGFDRVDNGYMQLKEVVVPRKAMLMKYVQVDQKGQVHGLQNKQAIKYGYGSMLFLRVKLVYSFAFSGVLYPAKQLALIYKKQNCLSQPKYRKQIIEYLCVGQGILLSNLNVQNMYNTLQAEIKAKNYKVADKILVQCHIISSTFKALTSWKALSISRDICSSSSYSIFKSSKIPRHFCDIVPSVTYQGDNSVLLQQTAKYILMKSKDQQPEKPASKFRDDQPQKILKILQYVTSMQIQRIKKIFKQQFQKGKTINTIWNQQYQRDILEVSKLWGYMNLTKSLLETLSGLQEHRQFFTKVGKIYVKNLLADAHQIFMYGFQVQYTESWKLITDEEMEALIGVRRLSIGEDIPAEMHERKGYDVRAKL